MWVKPRRLHTFGTLFGSPATARSWKNIFHIGSGTRAISNAYPDVYKRATENPDDFWYQAANQLTWFKKFTKVSQIQSYPRKKWFPGGELNMCYNCLDRHLDDGRGDQTALIYDSPATLTVKKFSYADMVDQVSKLAGQLVSLGVQKGDRVLIYMPMIPESIFSMLACSRIGAVHTVVFGGLAAKELASRIRHTQPKVILSASCGLEPKRTVWYKPILDEALKLADLPSNVHCMIYQRENYTPAKLKPGRDLDWMEAVSKRSKGHDCVPVSSDHPLYILFTSGTTGFPKGIVRSTGGHAVVLPHSLKTVFGMNRGDIWWGASDLGWVMGHSYVCYGPLLARLTNVLYEGKPVGTPDAGQFYRVLSDHKVNVMFTAPTTLRTIRREDPDNLQAKGLPLKPNSLRTIFLAGERCDSETRTWASHSFKVPILDSWMQTESGHPITAACLGLGQSAQDYPKGSCGMPVPGYQVEVMRENGKPAPRGELGRLLCKLPMPPGFMDTLYKSDQLYVAQYFRRYPGYYDTMDAGYIDEQGYVHVLARDDDVLSIQGYRISTSDIEEVLAEHPDLAEVAVIGIPDTEKGQIPLCFYVINKDSKKKESELTDELIALVKTKMGLAVSFKLAVAIRALPRTRSGKIPRKSLTELASNKTCHIPPTVEDFSVYEEIQKSLRKLGLGKESTLQF